MKPKPPADLWEGMDKIEAADHQPRFDGFTVIEYGKRYNVPRATADTKLSRLVDTGKLESGWKKSHGTWCRVFRVK